MNFFYVLRTLSAVPAFLCFVTTSPLPPSSSFVAPLFCPADERGVHSSDFGVAWRDGTSPSARAARALVVPGVRVCEDGAIHPRGDLL